MKTGNSKTEPQVRAVDGERFTLIVRSETTPNRPYRVELDTFEFNGSCTCKGFMCNFEKQLEAGAPVSDATRCKHIRIGRRWWARERAKEAFIAAWRELRG